MTTGEQLVAVVDSHGHPNNSGSRTAFLLRTRSCARSQRGYWSIWETSLPRLSHLHLMDAGNSLGADLSYR